MTTQPETHVITDLETPTLKLNKKKLAIVAVATTAIVAGAFFLKSKLTAETSESDDQSA